MPEPVPGPEEREGWEVTFVPRLLQEGYMIVS
jgi:hypothetical protein